MPMTASAAYRGITLIGSQSKVSQRSLSVDSKVDTYLRVMQHVEFLRGILAGIEHNGTLASRMIRQKIGDVQDLMRQVNKKAKEIKIGIADLAINHNPHIFFRRMLSDFLHGEFA